jgi:hypothetical protein
MHINFTIPDFLLGVLVTVIALPIIIYVLAILITWSAFGGRLFRKRRK